NGTQPPASLELLKTVVNEWAGSSRIEEPVALGPGPFYGEGENRKACVLAHQDRVSLADSGNRSPQRVAPRYHAYARETLALPGDEVKHAHPREFVHQLLRGYPGAGPMPSQRLRPDHGIEELLPVGSRACLLELVVLPLHPAQVLPQPVAAAFGRQLRQLALPSHRLGHDDPPRPAEPGSHPSVHL